MTRTAEQFTPGINDRLVRQPTETAEENVLTLCDDKRLKETLFYQRARERISSGSAGIVNSGELVDDLKKVFREEHSLEIDREPNKVIYTIVGSSIKLPPAAEKPKIFFNHQAAVLKEGQEVVIVRYKEEADQSPYAVYTRGNPPIKTTRQIVQAYCDTLTSRIVDYERSRTIGKPKKGGVVFSIE